MSAPENILLIRLKSIGDILFTLPAVHAVRENFPRARLHFLVSKEYAPLLRGFDDLNEIIPLDRAAFRSKNPLSICGSVVGLLRKLRQKKFSHAIDFQGYAETEMITWWSGAPERWGNVYRPLRGCFYTRVSERNREIHPVEWNLQLLRDCGLGIGPIRNEYVLPENELAEAGKIFADNHLDFARPTLFIQPFTSSPKKNWPLENHLTLARHFQSKGAQIIFGGGPSDKKNLTPARDAGFIVAAGAPLLVSAGLMKLSTVIVGADTGLLHLANAMGKRIVVLMRANTPRHSPPFQRNDWAVLPNGEKIMPAIKTNAVIDACAAAFADCEIEGI